MTVVTVTVVIFVTLVIVTVATVAVGTVVIVTYFSKNNLTPRQQMRYSQGSFSRFSRCFIDTMLLPEGGGFYTALFHIGSSLVSYKASA